MKIIIAILLFVSVQSFGQLAGYKYYAKKCNTNGSTDIYDVKLGTDSLFLRNTTQFVQFTKEHFAGQFDPTYPNGFENYIQDASGAYVHVNCILNNTTIIPPASVNALDGKANTVHTHTVSDLSNTTNVGANILTLSAPAVSASLIRINTNGAAVLRTATEAKQDLQLENVPNESKATMFSSPAFTGTASAANIAATGNILSSGGGIGYTTGNGGSVTQSGNKGTAVTINKLSGVITTTSAALAAGAEVSFNVNNSTVALTDVVQVSIQGGGTAGSYSVGVTATGAGFFTVTLSNLSTGSLSQAVVINFIVLKAVSN